MKLLRFPLAFPLLSLIILTWAIVSANQPAFQAQRTPNNKEETDWGQYLPAGNGKAYVQTLCSICHTLEKIVLQWRTEDEWRAVVGKMIGDQNAPISEEEAAEIIHYLGTHFAPRQEPWTAEAKAPTGASLQSEEIDWAMLLPEDNGKELVVAHCSSCHRLSVVVKSRKSRDAWYNTVTWMIGEFKAPVAETEIDAIVDYLSAHVGERNPITEVPMDVNAASSEALQRLKFLSGKDVDTIIRYRSAGRFDSLEQLGDLLGPDKTKSRLIKTYLKVR